MSSQLEDLLRPEGRETQNELLMNKLRKYPSQAKIYLALCLLNERKKKISTENVSKALYGVIPRVTIRRGLSNLWVMGFLKKKKEKNRVYYLPNRYTFKGEFKEIAMETIKKYT